MLRMLVVSTMALSPMLTKLVVLCALMVLVLVLFVLPSTKEQARLDGDLQPAHVEAPAIAQTASEQLLAVYPTMPSAGDGAGRRERVMFAQLPRPEE